MQCSAAYRCGEQHPTFKGRIAAHDGYVRIFKPGHPLAHKDGYVYEHRLVAYEAGLLTDSSHEVHHQNRDHADNHPGNLEPLSPIEHQRLHAEPGATVVNQYGVFAVRPEAKRRQR